jgi:uncharacterized protein YaaN involved in tellurite resistance
MIIPKRFTAEKTVFINVGGNTVPITTLNQEIIQEFEVLDRIKQDAATMTYQLEILAHAIKSKTADLSSMISEFYKTKAAEAAPDVPPSPESE